jgi:hypothetical protein
VGVSLQCKSNWEDGGNLTRSSVQKTPMTKWNERLEIEYTWRAKPFYNIFYPSSQLSCVLKDKNREIPFDYFVS